MGKGSKLLSPQAARVYKELLAAHEPATAQDIGSKLSTFPHSIYRVARELEQHGLVEKSRGRPVRFQAFAPTDIVDQFLSSYREWFLKSFASEHPKKIGVHDDFGVSFIRNRDESMKRSTQDLQSAKKEYFLIISGDEMPSETILATKQAADREVDVKAIVQRIDQGNEEMLKNWQKNDIKIRVSQTIMTRITIVDAKIAYLVSYDPQNYQEAFGVRFHYPPVAALIREMFMQKWKEAKPLKV